MSDQPTPVELQQDLDRLRAVVDHCMNEISLTTGWCVPGNRDALALWVSRLLERAYPLMPPVTDPSFWSQQAGYTFEEQNRDTFTLFFDRSPARHGLNLCRVSDFDHMGAQTRKMILQGLNELRYTATLEAVMRAALPALPPELADRFRRALDLKPAAKD